MTISNYAELRILDAIFNNTSLAVTNTYAQLHLGDPGEDGTANAAVNTTRKLASFTTAVAGSVTTDADLTWTTSEVTTTEVYSHISFWDATTAGNHLWNGPLTAAFSVNAGDTFTIAAGSGVITLD
jgi:hypothetical protein